MEKSEAYALIVKEAKRGRSLAEIQGKLTAAGYVSSKTDKPIQKSAIAYVIKSRNVKAAKKKYSRKPKMLVMPVVETTSMSNNIYLLVGSPEALIAAMKGLQSA
jgi:hypothetical protein